MKKVVKIVGILIGIVMGLILLFVLVLSIINFTSKKKEEALIKDAYGQMVEVDGKNMCVNIIGNGKQVVVILPGFGSISPVLEMASLAVRMSENYTVVTVEPFGYGLSDETDKERTLENIAEELHTVLQKLGYTKYTIMGHSLSGLYSIYYSNKYTDEVEAYVGIDSSVPKQVMNGDSSEGSIGQYKLLRFMNDAGIYRFLAALDSKGVVPKIKGYEYSEKEHRVYEALVYQNLINDTSLNEFAMSNQNFIKAEDKAFPKSIPVLYFLSRQNMEETENWYSIHEDVIKDKEHSRITVMEGSHYLHYEYSAEIATEFMKWAANKYK